MDLIRGLLCGAGSTDAGGSSSGTTITRPGLFDATPDVTVSLLSPGPKVAVAITGPDRGVTTLLKQQQQQQQQDTQSVAGFDISWRSSPPHQQPQQQQQHAHNGRPQQPHPQQQHPQQQQQHFQQQQQQQQCVWGAAISLYDMDPLTGLRNGDPIADCFAAIAYQQGAVLALADGVNWGERPRAAARGAVLGFCSSLHQQLAYAQGGRSLASPAAFAAMRSAVRAAQQQVLKADGTLTTLVGAVVCPKRWGRGGHVLLAACIGDSPCYVWRAATGTVDEVTYMPPLHGFHRDPRVCPGCLGYAIGDQPDLSNITYSLTHLQRGDLVILASDGIADNFDPVMRKQVLASSLPSKSPRASAAAQAAAAAALNGLGDTDPASQQYAELCSPSPAACHARAMTDIARVLRNACSPQQQQQPGKLAQQPPTQQQQQQKTGGAPAANGVLAGAGGLRPLQQPHAADGSSYASTGSSGGGSVLPALHTGSAGGRSGAGELPVFAAGADLTPRAAVEALMAFATDVTDAQRRVLEEAASRGGSGRRRGPELTDLLAGLPGKLDHASLVAYKVM